jgi:hypothetical protein
VNTKGSMQTGKNERAGEGLRQNALRHLPWPAIGGGLVAAIAVGLIMLAWALGGPRRADWIEQPIAAPNAAATTTLGSKP